MPRTRFWFIAWYFTLGCLLSGARIASADDPADQPPEQNGATLDTRRPANEAELRYWLSNMVWHHRFSPDEIAAATGLTDAEIKAALVRYNVSPATRPAREEAAPLLVLPYPGGRHPRIGFLDGAVRPQRETKISVFTPWDDASYVVADVPEAVWSNLGLTYLAHTHVPTIWTQRQIEMEPLEWNRRDDGTLDLERRLPNGITFGTRVTAQTDSVRMQMWLTNGTDEKLTDLRVQNCVMLGGAAGFTRQTNDNKVFQAPYAACRSDDGRRWVITAWDPADRTWGNANCPCLHADPRFADCPPGETVRLVGWLSFYEGTEIARELARIEETGWRTDRAAAAEPAALELAIVDASSGDALPARVYVQSEDGQWYFPHSLDSEGSAVPYRKQRGRSMEMHTTLSAHPARVQLPPGRYSVTVERGKEYHPRTVQVTMSGEPQTLRIALVRWIDMAKRGWYSGDTHVHRTLEELPSVMLAEDLNVALPLLSWVREAFAAPGGAEQDAPADDSVEPIVVDPTHVIYPRNTEYEIFTVDRAPHTLGAFFVLNHQRVFTRGVPPVAPVARQARAEGGLIELDKHNWPWSMMLVPVIDVDLFELSNNHVWRAPFGFPAFGEAAAQRMQIETDAQGFTEAGWLDFGFKNYYALLNCGFRLRPTAGTASGVHPVPLGFGRVYVHLPQGFSYDAWISGLNAGRSMVTTGPMLFVEVDRHPPGATIDRGDGDSAPVTVSGTAVSPVPLDKIEIVLNGEVVCSIQPENKQTDHDAYESDIHAELPLQSSSWIAVRCFEDRTDGRVRFAHTSPVHVDIAGKPLRPRRWEVDYFIDRVRVQLARSGPLLPPAARAEYETALRAFERIAETAQ